MCGEMPPTLVPIKPSLPPAAPRLRPAADPVDVEEWSLLDGLDDDAVSPQKMESQSLVFQPAMPPQPVGALVEPMLPCAPRLQPAADPFNLDDFDLSDFALPPAFDEEEVEDFALTAAAMADIAETAAEAIPLGAPRAPRLRPAADPVDAFSLPPLSLPPMELEGLGDLEEDGLFADGGDAVQMPSPPPPAPRLKPCADPIFADQIPEFWLPPLATVSEELEETGMSAEDEEEAPETFAAAFGLYMAALDGDDDGSSGSADFEPCLATDVSSEAMQEDFFATALNKRLEELDDLLPASPPSPAGSAGSSVAPFPWVRFTSSCSTQASTPRQPATRGKRAEEGPMPVSTPAVAEAAAAR